MRYTNAKVVWKNLYLLKKEGSMGIKIISEWNIALMVKHLKSICDAKQNQFGGIEFLQILSEVIHYGKFRFQKSHGGDGKIYWNLETWFNYLSRPLWAEGNLLTFDMIIGLLLGKYI